MIDENYNKLQIAYGTVFSQNLKILVEDLKVRGRKITFWNFRDTIRDCCVNVDPSLGEYFKDGSLDTVVTK